jgi:hypothetical protein
MEIQIILEVKKTGMTIAVVLGTLSVLGLVGGFAFWYRKRQLAGLGGNLDSETRPLIP